MALDPKDCDQCVRMLKWFAMNAAMTPSLAELPRPEAELCDLVRFAGAHDPTVKFRTAWGADFAPRALGLWQGHRAAFASGSPLPDGDTVGELLLSMNYQMAVAPHMAVSPDDVKAFCQWLIGGMRYLMLA